MKLIITLTSQNADRDDMVLAINQAGLAIANTLFTRGPILRGEVTRANIGQWELEED